jgi:hypothetical protein
MGKYVQKETGKNKLRGSDKDCKKQVVIMGAPSLSSFLCLCRYSRGEERDWHTEG